MNFKKTLIKSMAFALALGFLSVATPKIARADDSLTFVGAEEKATVQGYKYWGVAKEVKDEKKADFSYQGKFYKVDEVSEIVSGSIDLSFLNKKSVNIIAVGKVESFKSTENPWIVKEIAGQSKKFNAGFVNLVSEVAKIGTVDVPKGQTYHDSELGAFAVVNDTAAINLSQNNSAKTVEIKSGKSGIWVDANLFFGAASADEVPNEAAQKAVITRLTQHGANLAVRLKGTDTSWPSNEVKVKIAKQGKAPKLTVDTTKGVVNFKKGQEYKLALEGTQLTDAQWTDADGKKNFTGDSSLGIDGSKNVTIQVRDKATAKKAPSKITTVTLKKQAGFKVEALTKGGVLVADALTLVTKLPYDISKGAHIENKTEKEYEYVITYGAAVPTADAKWIKIKPGKKDKKKPAVIKPSKTAVKFSKEQKDNTYTISNENAKIYVRLAGTKQDKKDFSAMLPSPVSSEINNTSGSNTFKLANDQGAFTKPENTIAISGKANTAITKEQEIAFSNLFKDGSTPKITVTDKVNGVSVKASKMKKTGTGNQAAGKLTIKVSKTAFKSATSAPVPFKFNLNLEGVELKVTVNITIAN